MLSMRTNRLLPDLVPLIAFTSLSSNSRLGVQSGWTRPDRGSHVIDDGCTELSNEPGDCVVDGFDRRWIARYCVHC